MSDSDYQPSRWMQDAFGNHAVAVSRALARAASTAQTDGAEAKAGSRLPTNEPYGATVWLALARETAAELEDIGAETVRPSGCRYRLGILNETLVLSVKLPADSRGVNQMRITSVIRQRILGLAGVAGDTTLDFGDFDLLDGDGNAVADEEFGSANRAVLVVVEGSARGGVERIYIGDVRLGDFGQVQWLHREELPIAVAAGVIPGLVALESEPSSSFADAVVPEPTMGLVAEDGTAENDVTDASEVNDTGTEGRSNDES